MKAITPILDSMAVLAATADRGQDKNGILQLVDKTWLDNSDFKKVRIRTFFDPADFALRVGFGDFTGVGNDRKGTYMNYEGWEDPNGYYFSRQPIDSKGAHISEKTPYGIDPLKYCGVTVKTSWLNLCYLIDMATDVLAKEINKIPTHDPEGKQYSKKERLYRFHDAIEERIEVFIFDELPQYMHELLGHELTEVIRLIADEMQTIYQLMYLITDHKAGVGEGKFIWHVNEFWRDKGFLAMPHYCLDDKRQYFVFPVCSLFTFKNAYPWIDGTQEKILLSDLRKNGHCCCYFFEKCAELYKEGKLFDLKIHNSWQYLSIGHCSFNTGKIMKMVLECGLMTMTTSNNFILRCFAEEVAEKGVSSVNWDGVFQPDLFFIRF